MRGLPVLEDDLDVSSFNSVPAHERERQGRTKCALNSTGTARTDVRDVVQEFGRVTEAVRQNIASMYERCVFCFSRI